MCVRVPASASCWPELTEFNACVESGVSTFGFSVSALLLLRLVPCLAASSAPWPRPTPQTFGITDQNLTQPS